MDISLKTATISLRLKSTAYHTQMNRWCIPVLKSNEMTRLEKSPMNHNPAAQALKFQHILKLSRLLHEGKDTTLNDYKNKQLDWKTNAETFHTPT
jgi:hypothetical protein